MHGAGHAYAVLTATEEEIIHANVLRIVERVGLQVENDAFLERFAAIGGRVDRARKRVTFAPEAAEAFIASCRAPQERELTPRFSAGAGVYYGHYLDPLTGEFLPMTVDRLRQYFQVARALPHVTSMSLLGCPLQGIPSALEPLYERFWAWSLGAHADGSIHQVRLCPYIVEMCQVHAAVTGRKLAEVLTGTVYLVPPLKLGYQEAAQVQWFLDRGLRIRIGGSMATGGATAPVTLAGMVTITIAEQLLLGLLDWALYDEHGWGIGMSVTAMDPRTMMRPYGRPDMALASLVAAQMGRRYGVPVGGHGGLTDAMVPSFEAAAQKIQSALPTLMATGHAGIAAGLLAVDEVFSPVQMVLDDELTSSLSQFTREYEVSDASIAADVIEAVGPGGSFASEVHTAEWFRREMWEPTVFTRRNFAAWHEGDGKADVDRAREKVLDILAGPLPPSVIPETEDQDLRAIIARANNIVGGS